MRNVVTLAVAALLIAGAASHLVAKLDGPGSRDSVVMPPAASAASHAPAARSPVSSANVVAVPGDRSGHFRVNGVIGGRSVEFLVDTGASIIALTKRDADRLGLNPAARDYTARIQTANGVVKAANVRLASVSVGPITVHDVSAVVLPDGSLAQTCSACRSCHA